ncbi:MAG: metallophosphoesterase [SAR324 cluster bacterium]|nr:metallophosphoesterase [SAR324 cluster bacterium]
MFVVSSLNIPCFCVPGNHDKAFENSPPPGWQSLDGEIILYRNLTLMGLGGSMFYNGKSPYQYSEWAMRKRYWKLLPKLLWFRNRIGIFVSHAPAFELGDLENQAHRGYKTFRTILDRTKPRYFLHVHLSYGVIPRKQRYNNTEVTNGYESGQFRRWSSTRL